MNELPRYNPAAACPKCGDDEVGVMYRAAGDAYYVTQPNYHCERLHRQCANCLYEWDEAPLDVDARESGPASRQPEPIPNTAAEEKK